MKSVEDISSLNPYWLDLTKHLEKIKDAEIGLNPYWLDLTRKMLTDMVENLTV